MLFSEKVRQRELGRVMTKTFCLLFVVTCLALCLMMWGLTSQGLSSWQTLQGFSVALVIWSLCLQLIFWAEKQRVLHNCHLLSESRGERVEGVDGWISGRFVVCKKSMENDSIGHLRLICGKERELHSSFSFLLVPFFVWSSSCACLFLVWDIHQEKSVQGFSSAWLSYPVLLFLPFLLDLLQRRSLYSFSMVVGLGVYFNFALTTFPKFALWSHWHHVAPPLTTGVLLLCGIALFWWREYLIWKRQKRRVPDDEFSEQRAQKTSVFASFLFVVSLVMWGFASFSLALDIFFLGWEGQIWPFQACVMGLFVAAASYRFLQWFVCSWRGHNDSLSERFWNMTNWGARIALFLSIVLLGVGGWFPGGELLALPFWLLVVVAIDGVVWPRFFNLGLFVVLLGYFLFLSILPFWSTFLLTVVFFSFHVGRVLFVSFRFFSVPVR